MGGAHLSPLRGWPRFLFDPGAACFALAPGYLLATPSALPTTCGIAALPTTCGIAALPTTCGGITPTTSPMLGLRV
jgi:hypothetical protein